MKGKDDRTETIKVKQEKQHQVCTDTSLTQDLRHSNREGTHGQTEEAQNQNMKNSKSKPKYIIRINQNIV